MVKFKSIGDISSPSRRIALNTGFLYARMAITMFISLYATRLILKALGADDYGIFNLVGGAITMLMFLNNAMASASQRFMSFTLGEDNLEKLKRVFNVSVVLHFLVGLAIVVLLEIASFFLFDYVLEIPDNRIFAAKIIFQCLILSTFLTIISVPYDATINAHENMLFVAVLGIVEAILKLSIALYITYTAEVDRLILYGALIAGMRILLLLVRRIFCHVKYAEINYKVMDYFDKSLFKEMTSFAGWSFMSTTSRMVSIQGMSIVLNSFFGVIVNAAQGVANQVSGQLMSFSNMMLKALNPVIHKSEGADQRERMLTTAIAGSKISFFLFAIFAIPFIIEARYILNIWLKEVPDYAIVFCRLILIVSSVRQLAVTLPVAIGATGRIKESSLTETIIITALLPITVFLFKMNYDAYVIYLVLIFLELLVVCSRIWYTHRFCGLNIKEYTFDIILKNIIIYSGAIILVCFLTTLFDESIIRFLLSLVVSVLFISVSAYFLSLNKKEKMLLNSIIIRFYNKIKFNKR